VKLPMGRLRCPDFPNRPTDPRIRRHPARRRRVGRNPVSFVVPGHRALGKAARSRLITGGITPPQRRCWAGSREVGLH